MDKARRRCAGPTPGHLELRAIGSESIIDSECWIDRLDRSACFSGGELAGSLEGLKSRPAVSLGVLSGPLLRELTAAADGLPYRPARYEAGTPAARVYQEFDYCDAVPAGHPLRHMAGWFEMRLRGALALMDAPPMDVDFTINDVVCQRYRRGDLGITPHRDHIAYTQLITLVVLGGRGRYFVCADRRGGDRIEIDSGPGRAILMPGPGYAGRTDRPFHMVSSIASPRYSVGLRHDARRTG